MAKQAVEISWAELNDALGVVFNAPPNDEILSAVAPQAETWIAHVEKENAIELTAEERADILDALREFANQHWAIDNILSNHLDVDSVVEMVNSWSRRGATSGATDRRLPGGEGIIDWHETENGVRLTLSPAFLSAYVDALHCYESAIDDGVALKDVSAAMIVKAIRAIRECEDREAVTIDLAEWDKERDMPSFDAVTKMIEVIRERKERRKKR